MPFVPTTLLATAESICETGTDSTPRRRDGSLVLADAHRLPLPFSSSSAAADADMLPAGRSLRPRGRTDTGSAGGAQTPAAVPQAQRRRRSQGLLRPRGRSQQVPPSTSTVPCCKLSAPRNRPYQLWTTRLVERG
jgi:hypothetical protein